MNMSEVRIGTVFNKWKFIEKLEHYSYSHYWSLQCLGCGDIYKTNAYQILHKNGIQCRNCSTKDKSWSKIRNDTKLRKISDLDAARKFIFNILKGRAKHKKQSFKLDFKTVMDLITDNCFYCNKAPHMWCKSDADSRIEGFYRNGIDRKYSHLGYEHDNVVSCCGRCNMLKGDMPFELFLQHVKQICNHRKL